MAVIQKGNFQYGLWTALGVLAALTLWHLAQNKFPALNTGIQ